MTKLIDLRREHLKIAVKEQSRELLSLRNQLLKEKKTLKSLLNTMEQNVCLSVCLLVCQTEKSQRS